MTDLLIFLCVFWGLVLIALGIGKLYRMGSEDEGWDA